MMQQDRFPRMHVSEPVLVRRLSGQALARLLVAIGVDVKTYKRSGLDFLGIMRKDVQITLHFALNLEQLWEDKPLDHAVHRGT